MAGWQSAPTSACTLALCAGSWPGSQGPSGRFEGAEVPEGRNLLSWGPGYPLILTENFQGNAHGNHTCGPAVESVRDCLGMGFLWEWLCGGQDPPKPSWGVSHNKWDPSRLEARPRPWCLGQAVARHPHPAWTCVPCQRRSFTAAPLRRVPPSVWLSPPVNERLCQMT